MKKCSCIYCIQRVGVSDRKTLPRKDFDPPTRGKIELLRALLDATEGELETLQARIRHLIWRYRSTTQGIQRGWTCADDLEALLGKNKDEK